MTRALIERELKFDVPKRFTLPRLDAVLPAGGQLERVSQQLRSDYYDTADRALLRAGMTLRRRTGSDDLGWQLKVPHPPFRQEISTDLAGDDAVPDQLQQLLLGVGRGADLTRIATVNTDRFVTRVLDATGHTIAEIDDDAVRAAAPGDSVATLSRWREVEVELAAPDERLLHRLGKHLRRAGARPADHASKLARALPGPATGRSDGARPLRAGDVVGHYIAEQRRVLLAGDVALRRGDDTAIHKTRVAARRLRSTLRVFKPFFEPGPSAALDRELRWYAGLLGAVRDRQVLRERLDAMVADVDDSLLLGPVRARIDTELRQEQAENWHRLAEAMTGTRYLALLADLDRWVDDPPRTPAADRPGRAVAKRVRRAKQTVRRRLGRASATGDVALLHRARKAAKRARYAAEAAEPVLGARAAAHLAKQHRNLQDLLGEHQDSLVSAPLLRRLGASAGTTPGENGFAFGILHEREQANARQARAKVRAIVKHHRQHNRHR